MSRLLTIIAMCLWSGPALAAGGDFWTTTLLHTVNLLILLYLLVKAAGPKVKEAMAERSQTVGREITDAESRFAEAEEKLSSYEAKLAAATVPISRGFFKTVPIRLMSLESSRMNTSVTASRHFSFTIMTPVRAKAFQLIILNGSPGTYSRSE